MDAQQSGWMRGVPSKQLAKLHQQGASPRRAHAPLEDLNRAPPARSWREEEAEAEMVVVRRMVHVFYSSALVEACTGTKP